MSINNPPGTCFNSDVEPPSQQKPRTTTATKIAEILEDFTRRHAYGVVEITFQRGEVVTVRKTESLRLQDTNNSEHRSNREHYRNR